MNVAQILMLGVGAFVLWQYFSRDDGDGGNGAVVTPGGTTTTPGTTTQPGGTTTNPGTTTQPGGTTTTPGGPTTQPGGTTTTPQLTVAQITPLAAAGDRAWAAVLDERDVRYNVDQWNWYRVQGGRAAIAPEDMEILIHADEDRQQTLLASEYLARLERLGAGLSGLRRRSVWAT